MTGRIDHKRLLESVNIDLRKLMFALWIADSSTLKVVNQEKRHLYAPIYRDLDTLDYDVLGRLYTLKYDILEENEDIPNMTVASPGIYRGGLPNAEGFEKLKKMGIKTLVCSRNLSLPTGFEVTSDIQKASKPIFIINNN